MKNRKFFAIGKGVLAAAIVLTGAASADPVKMRISLDTGPSSSRVVWVQKFADAVEERTGGEIDTEVFHSGQLFRDADLAKALRQGNIEMGVPGSWQLGGFDPRMNMFQLPVVYGRSAEAIFTLIDGPLGKDLADSIEKQLGVKVIGGWLDLDSTSTFTTDKKVDTIADIAGLRIRYPGGAAIEEKLKLLDAVPVRVPFPDVALGLQRGNFDGLLSTVNTVVSAKLWDSGVENVYMDASSRDKFIPMLSEDFWTELSDEHKDIITDEWKKVLPMAREGVKGQVDADIQTLKDHGVTVVIPSSDELRNTRAMLSAKQDVIAESLGIPAEFVARVEAALADDPS